MPLLGPNMSELNRRRAVRVTCIVMGLGPPISRFGFKLRKCTRKLGAFFPVAFNKP